LKTGNEATFFLFEFPFPPRKDGMGFLTASTSFTRFRLVDDVPRDFWASVPDRLKRFAFREIDDSPEERSFGWTNFDDMLDTEWRLSPPEKADYLVFSLRLDTRRVPPAVLKKHTRLAIREEENRLRGLGHKFMSREQRKELAERVRLRLTGRFLPIPAEFQVVWGAGGKRLYLASTHRKVVDLFLEYFTRTFDLHLEQLLPYSLALDLLGDDAAERLDALEPTVFV
jgi:hypothetical protein